MVFLLSNEMKKYKFNYNKKIINYFLLNKVFKPNITTKLLLESINFKNKNKRILELGCGCGLISLIILKNKLTKKKINLSDISNIAVKNSVLNLKKFKKKYICKQSNLFEAWNKEKYDIIINDVSAISENLKKISPWFKNIPCATDKDGSKLTIEILEESQKYLYKNGILYFPVLSLSNSKKILRKARKIFSNVKLEKSIDWPLPAEMIRHHKKLNEMKKKKQISFMKKYGQLIANTSIFSAKI